MFDKNDLDYTQKLHSQRQFLRSDNLLKGGIFIGKFKRSMIEGNSLPLKVELGRVIFSSIMFNNVLQVKIHNIFPLK